MKKQKIRNTDVEHVNELRIFKTIRSIYLGQLTSNKNLQNKFLRRQNSRVFQVEQETV